jgi:hypothetical protein
LHRQLLDLEEDEHRALLFGEDIEQNKQATTELALLDLVVLIRCHRDLRCFGDGIFQSASHRAPMIVRDVDAYLPHPGAHGPTAKARELPMNDDEYLLAGVLDVGLADTEVT